MMGIFLCRTCLFSVVAHLTEAEYAQITHDGHHCPECMTKTETAALLPPEFLQGRGPALLNGTEAWLTLCTGAPVPTPSLPVPDLIVPLLDQTEVKTLEYRVVGERVVITSIRLSSGHTLVLSPSTHGCAVTKVISATTFTEKAC